MSKENNSKKEMDYTLLNVLDSVPGGIAKFCFNDSFQLLYANTGFYDMMGFSRKDYENKFQLSFGMSVEVEEGERIYVLFKQKIRSEISFGLEYWHQMPDGTLKLIYMQVRPVEEDGQSVFYGSFTDITNLKEKALPLSISEEQGQVMKIFSGKSLFEYHITTKTMKYMPLFSQSNENDEVVLNYRETFLAKKMVFPDDIEVFEKLCDNFDSGVPIIECELRIADDNGKFVWCKIQAATICNKQGTPFKVVGKIENIDAHKRETERFKEKSKRDPLTGFYNKVVIEEAVEEHLLLEPSQLGAFMVIDIDNFKMINDTQGHLFGDAVLLDIAAELKTVFRSTDLIGRIGGDEFVAFIKNVPSLAVVEQKANEICRRCSNLYAGQKNKLKISCSIGIALYPEHGTTYRELFRKADQALYATKGFNKDDFTIYGMSSRVLPTEECTVKSMAKNNDERSNRQPMSAKLSLIRIFEMLFDTKDIQYGINIVIELIGNHYGLDRVYILENIGQGNDVKVTYEWCRESVASRRLDSSVQYYTVGNTRLFFCEDVDESSLPEAIKCDLQLHQVKAIVQYALHENGKFNGTIAFESCCACRKWPEEDIEALMIISKFIGSYLVKMQVQHEIEKLAYTDQLTGMWNLNKFKLAATRLLENTADKKYALICFDVKKFRYINDTFGFDVGDEILLYIANHLRQILTKEMVFTRASADKFLVMLSYESVENILHSLNFSMETLQYFVSPKTGRYKLVFNAGIYLIEPEDTSINAIIDKADIARSNAHSGHNSNYVFYNEDFRQKLMKEKEIEDLVDYALEYKEFVVYYQPKVDLLTGAVKGAEALVRWVSPLKGFMSPAEFIPLFEKNGFIAKLDFYVFERVFYDLRRWLDQGKNIMPISVNLSRVHLSDSTFIDKLMALLKKYDIDPKIIEIELTESVFMENIGSVLEVMNQLKKIGFSISIDDFGSGYSSLRLLRDLPVDYLKLDKEFLDNGDSSIREQIIIMNVIRMAKTLGIKVVSEGVETDTQAMFLKSCACDLVQGFLYAKPMPVDKFEELLTI